MRCLSPAVYYVIAGRYDLARQSIADIPNPEHRIKVGKVCYFIYHNPQCI